MGSDNGAGGGVSMGVLVRPARWSAAPGLGVGVRRGSRSTRTVKLDPWSGGSGDGQPTQLGECAGQGEGPRPAGLQPKPGPSTRAADPGGGVEESVADGLPLGPGQVGGVLQEDGLGPGE